MSIMNNNLMVNETGSSVNIENYKLVTIGDQCVGKTSILSRYKYEAMDEIYSPTVGIDFLSKNVFLEDKTIRLIMWDTAGQERFKSLIPSYLKNADIVLLVFDLTNKNTFNSLPKWLNDIRDNIQDGVEVVVCGNKQDLKNKRNITYEEAEKFCKEQNLNYVETSALTGEGIEKLFNTIIGFFYDIQDINHYGNGININNNNSNNEEQENNVSFHKDSEIVNDFGNNSSSEVNNNIENKSVKEARSSTRGISLSDKLTVNLNQAKKTKSNACCAGKKKK